MQINPARVDELLRSIAEKKIDPDSAARSLLATNAPLSRPPEPASLEPSPAVESMLSLVRRLGPPPAEIEADWKQQIQSLAQSWHARENRPLPPLTLDDWLVDAQNRISLSPRVTVTAVPNAFPSPAFEPQTAPLTQSAPIATDKPTAKQPTPHKRHRVDIRVIAASIAATALILVLVVATSRRNTPDDSSVSSEQHSTATNESLTPSPFDPGFIAAPHQPADEAADLQAGVMAMAEAAPLLAQPVAPLMPQLDFGFDNPLLGGSSQDAANPPTEPASTPPLDRPANTNTDWDADTIEPEDASAIADQSVESATPRQAVTLPPLRPTSPRPASSQGEAPQDAPADDSTVIGVNLIRDAQWEFPHSTNIHFVASKAAGENDSDERSTRWYWTDTTSGTQLAMLDQIDQQLVFRWSEHATTHQQSRQIAAGRLRLSDSTGQSSAVFLRPHLRTSPLRLDAAEPDSRLSWPLEGPATYQAPKLTLEATQPEKVDMSWIEPPDPTNIRKQIGILQWAPAGKPSPAIRCQIECKATTRLQMRLRYFAQLDSTFPWQPYSATQLITALDQVTQLLERRTAELSQLERHYQNATTSDRRSIRPLKENAEQSVTQIRSVLQQLQQLNVLHSAVAATSHLQLTLTTDWPDGPQTILEIPLPDK